MSSWSQQRKSTYAAIVILAAVVIVGVPAFLLFYKSPTCSDGVKNGNEKAIDCGGTCPQLCQSDFLAPVVGWTRFEEVVPGLYNAAAYIINPNPFGEAKNVAYRMAVYDAAGILIIEKNGSVTIPPHRHTLAFMGSISTGASKPAKVFFEFSQVPQWQKSQDRLEGLILDGGSYLETDSGSSFTVTLRNPGLASVRNVTVYVILKDSSGNAIGFSRTFVDEVPAQGSAVAPFTWPKNRGGRVVSEEILPSLE